MAFLFTRDNPTDMKRSALCLVDTEDQAYALVRKLRSAGFSDNDISLAGIGALAMPGLAPFIAAGPIKVALTESAIGAFGGGLTGAVVGLGIPGYIAKSYERRVKEGGILLAVHSESRNETNRVKDIFKEAGAHAISSTAETDSYVKADKASHTDNGIN